MPTVPRRRHSIPATPIRSAVTVSLVPEARGGPFVFWDDLPAACAKAATYGFDAVEVFAPAGDSLRSGDLRKLLADNGLQLAAAGTGAGWVKHKLRLTDPSAAHRARAIGFVKGIIDVAGPLGAPAIVGSMQGRWGDDVSRDACLGYLGEAIVALGEHAGQYDVPLLYETLNRYETNLLTTIADGVQFLQALGEGSNVKLLADLFHMNIEEPNLADALCAGGALIGHVHLADSNRRPAGCGHTDLAAVANALRQIRYTGYVSAECLPWPGPDEAARLTIEAYRKDFAAIS
jgi:sugar phosphate isomerase/epimerase